MTILLSLSSKGANRATLHPLPPVSSFCPSSHVAFLGWFVWRVSQQRAARNISRPARRWSARWCQNVKSWSAAGLRTRVVPFFFRRERRELFDVLRGFFSPNFWTCLPRDRANVLEPRLYSFTTYSMDVSFMHMANLVRESVGRVGSDLSSPGETSFPCTPSLIFLRQKLAFTRLRNWKRKKRGKKKRGVHVEI